MGRIEWFEIDGTVEVLGDSQIHQQGRTYSVVKLRGGDGRLQSLEKVHTLPRVTALLHVGQRVQLLGYKARGEHQAVAAASSDERVDDAELLNQAGRYLRIMRLGALALAVFPIASAMIEPYGTPIAALIAWPLAVLLWLAHGRRAALVPSRDELQRRVAAFNAA